MKQNDFGISLMAELGPPLQIKEAVKDLVSSVNRLCTVGDSDESSPREIVGRVKDFLGMIPRDNKKKSAEYLRLFESFGAPKALVSLFNSPIKSYKEIGEESIRLFFNPHICKLPRIIQNQCASLVSEFSTHLFITNDHDNPLYISSRNTVGYLLRSIGFANRSRYFRSVWSRSYLVRLFSRYACDLANRLTEDFTLIMESSSLSSCLRLRIESHIQEFALFSLHTRRAIEDHFKSKGQSLPLCLDDNFNTHPCYLEEIELFYDVFIDLLQWICHCMHQMGKNIRDAEDVSKFNHGWSYYLYGLKELNNFCKLFQGAKEELSSAFRLYQFSLNKLISYSKRSDDHQWLLKYNNVIDFKTRRHLMGMMFPEMNGDDLHKVVVDRSQLLTESFELMVHANPRSVRNGVIMEFKNEIATGHGVMREWLILLCQELFDPQNSLFLACPSDRRRFFPNPAKLDPCHLDYFGFCGQVIAMALMYNVQVGIAFDRVFFLQLAGEGISLEDLRDADPCLYKSCKTILEMDSDYMDSDAMGLTFVKEIEELGCREVVELCPGGNTITVNSKNREEYVHLLIQHCFVKSISKKVAYFARGFGDILYRKKLQKVFFQSLELNDLDLMLLGTDKAICVKDWKAHTNYDDYKETDDEICWFWKVVEGMSSEQQRELLFFWTSVKYLPVNGFSGLPSRLYIYKTSGSHYRLPSSHTCFYRLSLPPYPSLAVMQQHLSLICQEHVGCTFGLS